MFKLLAVSITDCRPSRSESEHATQVMIRSKHNRHLVASCALAVLGSCASPPAPSSIYLGCNADGHGQIQLNPDGSYLLWLLFAEGKTDWAICGRWFANTYWTTDPRDGTGYYSIGLIIDDWKMQWSTEPGLSHADLWRPEPNLALVADVDESGMMYLRMAGATFVLNPSEARLAVSHSL